MNKTTITLKNHLSDSDLSYLRQMKKICKNDPKSVRNRTIKKSRQNKLYILNNETIVTREEIANWINDRLPFENKEEYEFYSINFYDIQIPYSLHSDTSPDKKYFYQGIIPLGVHPQDKDAYTLIFDQTAEENVEWTPSVFNRPEDDESFNNKIIRDPNYFDNWKEGYKLPVEDCKKYFGTDWEFLQTAYEGFTIHTEYKWNIGDIFLFDSRHVHCATGLETKDIDSKEGLLFILKKK